MFVCSKCGERVEGDEYDALIYDEFLGQKETVAVYKSILTTAPHDPATQLVKRTCEKCGRPYMSVMRVGDAERIIYLCKCGNRVDV